MPSFNDSTMPQIKPPLSLGLDNTTPIVCEHCQGDTFVEAFKFRKVSAIISPDGREGTLPFTTFVCVSCKKVPVLFDPFIEDKIQ